ncbi:hypothetical protein D3C80_1386730 [compost metagenome]
MTRQAFNLGRGADIALFVLEDGVAEHVVADAEGPDVERAVRIHGGEVPPDHVHAVVDDQVLLVVDRAPLGEVGLIQRDHALDCVAVADPGHLVHLDRVEGAPVDPWKIPLHAHAQQFALEVEQSLFGPAESRRGGRDPPGVSGVRIR